MTFQHALDLLKLVSEKILVSKFALGTPCNGTSFSHPQKDNNLVKITHETLLCFCVLKLKNSQISRGKSRMLYGTCLLFLMQRILQLNICSHSFACDTKENTCHLPTNRYFQIKSFCLLTTFISLPKSPYLMRISVIKKSNVKEKEGCTSTDKAALLAFGT